MFFHLSDLHSNQAIGEEAQRMFAHRLQPGDEIFVTNLQGQVARANIIKYDKQKRVFEVSCHTIEYRPAQTKVLFQAILDKQYMEKWAEAAGFGNFKTIYLFEAERSQKRTVELGRIKKIMMNSALLAERAWMPDLVLINSNDLLESLYKSERPVICDIHGESKSMSISCILIGPEGGFSQNEYARFDKLNLSRVSLGDYTYPAWLAGLVASL